MRISFPAYRTCLLLIVAGSISQGRGEPNGDFDSSISGFPFFHLFFNTNNNHPEVDRRSGSSLASEFIGRRKRAPGSEFLGKRAPGSEFLGKRVPGSEFLGKRAPGSEFLGKRVPGSEFLGKRAPGSEFLGKRVPGSEFLGKRAPGSEFLGKRAHGGRYYGLYGGLGDLNSLYGLMHKRVPEVASAGLQSDRELNMKKLLQLA